MKDLDQHGQNCEKAFGLISRFYVYALWQMSVNAGSDWKYEQPDTIDIVVTRENADGIYAYCKAIRSGYDVGLGRTQMSKIKRARMIAHKFLVEEANDPNTSIQRKIELVRLTSK